MSAERSPEARRRRPTTTARWTSTPPIAIATKFQRRTPSPFDSRGGRAVPPSFWWHHVRAGGPGRASPLIFGTPPSAPRFEPPWTVWKPTRTESGTERARKKNLGTTVYSTWSIQTLVGVFSSSSSTPNAHAGAFFTGGDDVIRGDPLPLHRRHARRGEVQRRRVRPLRRAPTPPSREFRRDLLRTRRRARRDPWDSEHAVSCSRLDFESVVAPVNASNASGSAANAARARSGEASMRIAGTRVAPADALRVPVSNERGQQALWSRRRGLPRSSPTPGHGRDADGRRRKRERTPKAPLFTLSSSAPSRIAARDARACLPTPPSASSSRRRRRQATA